MELVNQELQTYRDRLSETVKELHNLCAEIDNRELSEVVSDLRNRIGEPYMFVVVGEVKAGKSSFINALLKTEEEICAVAPDPKTDAIHLIEYGEAHEVENISPTLKKIYYPEEILREIAIVDTPGTNTIIEYHQEITEKFIPASDLVMFVFEAKNPYRQSAWDFFRYVSEEWHKKIVFILQQKDLMSEEDLAVNQKGLKDYALKQGMENPTIFTVSAKQELEGFHSESGFEEVRSYIESNITGGKAPILKLKNNIDTFLRIYKQIESGLETRQTQLELDKAFRKDVEKVLEEEQQLTEKRISIFIENLLNAYDKTVGNIRSELKSELSIGNILGASLKSIFGGKSSIKKRMEELTSKLGADLQNAMNAKIDEGVEDISEGIKQMLRIIDLKIQNSETVLRNDHEIFSHIGLKREQVMAELSQSFKELMRSSDALVSQQIMKEHHKIGREIMSGGGLAIIGVIIATVTQMTIFDITGGILTTIGLLFAGVSTGIKRRKILAEFDQTVKKGHQKLGEEVQEKLENFVQRLKDQILNVFGKFDKHIEEEHGKMEFLREKSTEIKENLDKINEFIISKLRE